MRRSLSLALLATLLAAPAAPGEQAARTAAQLAERHQRWLEDEVTWILTKAEREEFLALPGDAGRDEFIERFWRIRDPQPLTAQNEFRDEHERRLRHANRFLGSDAPRPGSRTDRGRAYILLGQPTDVERVVSNNEVYPYELWFYGNTAALGLPGQVRLIFYRPHGVGEYRLLNPMLERDRLFPPSSQINAGDPSQVRFALGPELAQALEAVAPGAGASASDEILQEIQAPRRIPERIRDRGLALHPEVRTRWSLEQLPLGLKSMVVPDEDGAARVHLGAELPPREVTFQEVEGGLFLARIDVFGNIVDERGVEVARLDEVATLSLTRRQVEERRASAFAFEAVRTLVPGRYRVSLYLQDYGRGKLGQAGGEVVVPAPPSGPALAPLVLAFRVESAESQAWTPFHAQGFQVYPRPGGRYRLGDPLYVFALLHGAPAGELRVSVSVDRGDEQVFSAAARSAARPGTGPRPLLLSVPTTGLAALPHRVTLKVSDGETPLAAGQADLLLVEETLPEGLLVYRERRQAPPEVEHFNRGVQLLSRGDLTAAERHFRIALDHRPNFRPASVFLARALLQEGKTAAAEPLLRQVLEHDPTDYDALLAIASLELGRGGYAESAAALHRALEVGSRTKELLNALAEASLGLRDTAAARRYYQESLAIDPAQEMVRRRLGTLGGS